MSKLSEKAVNLLRTNAEEFKEIMKEYWHGMGYYDVDSFIKLHTSPPVRFKDFHGNEVAKGSIYWFVMEDYTLYKAMCDNKSGIDPLCKYFSTEKAAKDWIELNKPCELSVNDIVEWWFNKSEENNTMREAKNDLLELIKAKKQ